MSYSNLLTIGVPTYKRPELCVRCVNSLLAQSIVPDRIIISANSYEDYILLCDKFGGIHNIEVIGGDEVSSYLNFGRPLFAAQTPYFMWLADDMYFPSIFAIQNLLFAIKDGSSFFIASPYSYIIDGGDIRHCTRYNCSSLDYKERLLAYAEALMNDNTVFYSAFPTKFLVEVYVSSRNKLEKYGKHWACACDWLMFSDLLYFLPNKYITGFTLARDETQYTHKYISNSKYICNDFAVTNHIEAIASAFFVNIFIASEHWLVIPIAQRYALARQCAVAILSNYRLPSGSMNIYQNVISSYQGSPLLEELWQVLSVQV